jgi:hypothetical protein
VPPRQFAAAAASRRTCRCNDISFCHKSFLCLNEAPEVPAVSNDRALEHFPEKRIRFSEDEMLQYV